jgi:putative ABC transport system ATP-binding protein
MNTSGNMDPCAPDQPLIRLQDVSKVFKTQAGEFVALKNIDLDFMKCEFAAIMGKSGSGKSTLLNMITGIDHPTEGEVCVSDTCIHKMREGDLAVWRGKNLGIVFQFFQLLPMLTVLENTMLPMDLCNMYDPSQRETRALNILQRLGIEDTAHKSPMSLSLGQHQVAAVARALANEPAVIVADEPTGNLDTKTADQIMDLFNELVSQGKTVIIVTHDSHLAQRAGRIVLISDGELINPTIVSTFPDLAHSTMLQLTHLVKPLEVMPGEPIPLPEEGGAGLYIIQQGNVEIMKLNRSGEIELVDNLGEDSFFSNQDMAFIKNGRILFRANPHQPVKLLRMEMEDLLKLTAICEPLRLALTNQSEYWRVKSPRPKFSFIRSRS